MAWIGYKKAFDSVPHSWLIECMQMFKVNGDLVNFIKGEMGKWCTELTSAGKVLGKVPIQRGIFQGDALSPLLFIMTMIPISRTLRRMKKGYEMDKGKDMITHLLYMDDLKLYAKTEDGMKSMTNTVKMISEDIAISHKHPAGLLHTNRQSHPGTQTRLGRGGQGPERSHHH